MTVLEASFVTTNQRKTNNEQRGGRRSISVFMAFCGCVIITIFILSIYYQKFPWTSLICVTERNIEIRPTWQILWNLWNLLFYKITNCYHFIFSNLPMTQKMWKICDESHTASHTCGNVANEWLRQIWTVTRATVNSTFLE